MSNAKKSTTVKTEDNSKDLMAMALAATSKNVSTTKSRKSINDHLFEMLYKEDRAMDRKDVINEISFRRLKEEVGEVTEEKLQKAIEDGEWASINKTVKNGLDTAVCNGKTSASFCSNETYVDYELIKVSNSLSIEKK